MKEHRSFLIKNCTRLQAAYVFVEYMIVFVKIVLTFSHQIKIQKDQQETL